MNPPSLIEAVVVAIVLIAAILDLRSRRIPNWLTLPGVLVGISLNTALSGTPGLISALKGMGLALLIYLPLFALRTPHGVAIAIGTFLFFALRPKWFQ